MTIKLSDLEAVTKRINQITGNPEKPYVNENGKCVAQIGCYHLDGAYGGYALHRIQNQGGGAEDIFRCGHVSKRELYNRMQSFISGLEFKK